MRHGAKLTRRLRDALARRAAFLWSDDSGSPAVEFALIAPVFLFILTATFDVGAIIRERFKQDARISSAASFGQLNGISIDDDGATAFAGRLAEILSAGRDTVDATVVLNNAALARIQDGALTTTDTGGIMAQCYCPSRVADQIQWGGSRTCLSPCGDGSTAGRFIEIDTKTEYISLFGGFGMTTDDVISTNAIMRLE